MPVYEYRCRACGTPREEIQSLGAGPPGPCLVCGGDLRRVYGRVGVRFSGWGFSRNDALIGDERGPRKDFKKLREKAEEISDS